MSAFMVRDISSRLNIYVLYLKKNIVNIKSKCGPAIFSQVSIINYLREAQDKLHLSFCIESKLQIRDVTTIKSNSQDSSLPIVNENALPIVNEILTIFHSTSFHSNKKKRQYCI